MTIAWLRRITARLAASPQDLDNQQLQKYQKLYKSMPIAECTHQRMMTLTGRLRTIVYNPSQTHRSLEAELFDGSGAIGLVWLGQNAIAGIEAGRVITVTGRAVQRSGQLVMYNPVYVLH